MPNSDAKARSGSCHKTCRIEFYMSIKTLSRWRFAGNNDSFDFPRNANFSNFLYIICIWLFGNVNKWSLQLYHVLLTWIWIKFHQLSNIYYILYHWKMKPPHVPNVLMTRKEKKHAEDEKKILFQFKWIGREENNFCDQYWI